MVNKEHPDYQEYVKKFRTIWGKMSDELEEAHKKLQECNYKGLDDPYTNSINRKYHKQIKELQQKYKHIFTE